MKMKPNTLLKIDDLYWNDFEKKFVALSTDEMSKVILAAFEDCPDEARTTEMATEVVRWAEHARISSLILQGVLSGRLGMRMEPGMEEPIFYELEKSYDDAKHDAQ